MTEKSQSHSIESLRNEYSEVNENFRHFSSLRFAIFTVYFAVEAGILSAFTSGNFNSIAVVSGGLIITFVFWGYQERNIRLISHFMQVAAKLERQLGYTQISTRPPAKFPVPDINTITRLFFPLMIVFWIYTLVTQ
jgi:hypothetical protein